MMAIATLNFFALLAFAMVVFIRWSTAERSYSEACIVTYVFVGLELVLKLCDAFLPILVTASCFPESAVPPFNNTYLAPNCPQPCGMGDLFAMYALYSLAKVAIGWTDISLSTPILCRKPTDWYRFTGFFNADQADLATARLRRSGAKRRRGRGGGGEHISSMGKYIEGTEMVVPSETTQYVVNTRSMILGLVAINPVNNGWMLYGMAHKLILEPDGSWQFVGACGNSINRGVTSDFWRVSIVSGAASRGCSCLSAYVLELVFTDAGYERQKQIKKCCVARTLYLPAKEIDRIIKDIGLVERGQLA